MKYKVIPFTASVSSHQIASAGSSAIASQIETLINAETSDGVWEYVGVNQLQTIKAGSSGCFGFGATPETTVTTEFVVFRK